MRCPIPCLSLVQYQLSRGSRCPPLLLDQTEARWAEEKFFGDRPPSLSQGLDDRAPLLLSQGLVPALQPHKVPFSQQAYFFEQ